jgi:hypothetical protein
MFINSAHNQCRDLFLHHAPNLLRGQSQLLYRSRAHNRGQHQSQSRAHNQCRDLFLHHAPNLLHGLSQCLFHAPNLLLVPCLSLLDLSLLDLSLLDQDPFLLSPCPGSIAEGHGNRAPITTERGVWN